MGWLDRDQEKEILSLTDQVIEAAMALGLVAEEEKEERLRQAREKVSSLAGLVLPLLEGDGNRLPDLLQQLVRQKLPDQNILTSFGSFSQDLERLLGEGLADRGGTESEKSQASQESVRLADLERELAEMAGEDRRSAEEEIQPPQFGGEPPVPAYPALREPALTTLEALFPGEEVRRRHLFHGVVLDYYLPGVALAVAEGPPPAGEGRRELLCRRYGLRLAYLSPGDLSNPRRAARRLKGENCS